jgi:hypothetical protein
MSSLSKKTDQHLSPQDIQFEGTIVWLLLDLYQNVLVYCFLSGIILHVAIPNTILMYSFNGVEPVNHTHLQQT